MEKQGLQLNSLFAVILFFILVASPVLAQDYNNAEDAYDAIYDSNVDLNLKEESLFKLVEEESSSQVEEPEPTKDKKSNIREQSLLFNTYSKVGKKLNLKSGELVKVSLKNEFEQSLKVKLKLFEQKESYRDIFINPYQVVNIGEMKTGTYQLELFDVSDNFLGYILEDVSSDKTIFALNRLKLRSSVDFNDEEDVAFGELQKQALKAIDIRSETSQSPQNTANKLITNKAKLKRSTVQIYNKKRRAIKIANESSQNLQVNILQNNGNKIGNGWTISQKVRNPEYLLFDSQKVMLAPDYKLVISEGKDYEPITVNAKELEINKQGDYILIIGP